MPKGHKNVPAAKAPQQEAAQADQDAVVEAEVSAQYLAALERVGAKTKTVPMAREGKTADVHPNEVEHMKQHGWEVKE